MTISPRPDWSPFRASDFCKFLSSLAMPGTLVLIVLLASTVTSLGQTYTVLDGTTANEPAGLMAEQIIVEEGGIFNVGGTLTYKFIDNGAGTLLPQDFFQIHGQVNTTDVISVNHHTYSPETTVHETGELVINHDFSGVINNKGILTVNGATLDQFIDVSGGGEVYLNNANVTQAIFQNSGTLHASGHIGSLFLEDGTGTLTDFKVTDQLVVDYMGATLHANTMDVEGDLILQMYHLSDGLTLRGNSDQINGILTVTNATIGARGSSFANPLILGTHDVVLNNGHLEGAVKDSNLVDNFDVYGDSSIGASFTPLAVNLSRLKINEFSSLTVKSLSDAYIGEINMKFGSVLNVEADTLFLNSLTGSTFGPAPTLRGLLEIGTPSSGEIDVSDLRIEGPTTEITQNGSVTYISSDYVKIHPDYLINENLLSFSGNLELLGYTQLHGEEFTLAFGGIVNDNTTSIYDDLRISGDFIGRGQILADTTVRGSSFILNGGLTMGSTERRYGVDIMGTHVRTQEYTLTLLDPDQVKFTDNFSTGAVGVIELGPSSGGGYGTLVAVNGIQVEGDAHFTGAGVIFGEIDTTSANAPFAPSRVLSLDENLDFGSGLVTLLSSAPTLASAELNMAGGHVNAINGIHFTSTGSFLGFGTLDGTTRSDAGSTIFVNGDELILGDAASPDGVNLEGDLIAGANDVTLLDADAAHLGGASAFSGGKLTADNGLDVSGTLSGTGATVETSDLHLMSGGNLNGSFTINADHAVLDGTVTGSGTVNANVSGSGVITATGDFALGNGASDTGFEYGLTLNVGSHNVTLHDADAAGLGLQTNQAGGVLQAENGFWLGTGDQIAGHGLILGVVDGPGAATGLFGSSQYLSQQDRVFQMESTILTNQAAVIGHHYELEGTALHVSNGQALSLTATGELSGTGEVDAAMLGVSGSQITVGGGSLTVGTDTSDGFDYGGDITLANSSSRLVIRDADSTTLDGDIELNGGQIRSDAAMVLNGTVTGRGTIAAALSGEAIFNLDGSLSLGDSSVADSVQLTGTIHAGSHLVQLRSSNTARVETITLSGGRVSAPNGLSLQVGDSLSGYGFINAPLSTNFGHIEVTGGTLELEQAFTGYANVDGDGLLLLKNGSGFTGNGFINARLQAEEGADVTATGTLTLGSDAGGQGVDVHQLNVANYKVTLQNSQRSQTEVVTMNGGTIYAASGLNVDTLLSGRGTIEGAVTVQELNVTSGTMTLGDSSLPNGVIINGPATIDGNLNLLSATPARLNGASTISGFQTITATNLQVDGSLTGDGMVDGKVTGTGLLGGSFTVNEIDFGGTVNVGNGEEFLVTGPNLSTIGTTNLTGGRMDDLGGGGWSFDEFSGSGIVTGQVSATNVEATGNLELGQGSTDFSAESLEVQAGETRLRSSNTARVTENLEVATGATLRANAGVIVPDAPVSGPSLTPQVDVSGTVDGTVSIGQSAEVRLRGNAVLGDASRTDGFESQSGILFAAYSDVTLLDADVVEISGSTSTVFGELTVANGLRHDGQLRVESGTIHGAVETNSFLATGSSRIGDSGSNEGVVLTGDAVVSGHLTLLDGDRAELGASTTLNNAEVYSEHGFTLEAGDTIQGSGLLRSHRQFGNIVDGDGVLNATSAFTGNSVAVGGDQVLLLSSAPVTLSSFTLNGGTFDFDGRLTYTGADLNGTGEINTQFYGTASSVISLSGGTFLNSMTVGDADSFLGFRTEGLIFTEPGDFLILRSKGFASLGSYTQADGAILAANGVSLGAGDVLEGGGSVVGKVAADSGSIISATGDLTLGNADALDGFFSQGELRVGDNSVTIHDANEAVLGSLTTLGHEDGPQVATPPVGGSSSSSGTIGGGGGSSSISDGSGTLVAANGLLVDFGRNVTGFGTIETPNDADMPLINNGTIQGYSSDAPITLTGYVKGVGEFIDVEVEGTFSPGLSPAIVTVENLTLTETSVLVMELGGTTAGAEYDQLDIEGFLMADGTLSLVLIDGYIPSVSDSFMLFDGPVSGEFELLDLPELASGQQWDVSQLYTNHTVSVAAVPEPGTSSLVLLVASAFLLRRKKP